MAAAAHLGGTVKPHPGFDAAKCCEALRKAMKGIGTDEKAIIEILTTHSADQRVAMLTQFKTMYGKDLIAEFKSELGGNLENCVLALMRTTTELDAWCLYDAMSGAGTTEETLIEILATRSNAQIKAIKEAYTRMFKKDLEKAIASETSGHFKRILISLVQANRDESGHTDVAKAAAAAKALHDAGEKKFGTDESQFNLIFMTNGVAQLRVILDEYRKISGYDLSRVVEKEMSGNLENAFLCLIDGARNPAQLFADRLHKAMKGAGTDEKTLIRIICGRSEIDLEDIKKCYIDKYSKHLSKMVKDDCNGDFERILLALIK